MNDMLKVKNLSFSYSGVKVLENINFNLEKGKIYILLGKNGSGKSTLIKLIANILKFKNGEIYFENKKINELNPKEFSKKIAYLAQENNFFYDLSVYEIVKMGRYAQKNKNKEFEKNLILNALLETGVLELKDRNINELSGGQRQRVLISRLLCQDSPLILLDEPISFLDLKYQREVLKILKKLKSKNKTILMILHDLNLASEFADEIIFIKDGKIVKIEKPEKIIEKDIIKNVFDLDVEIKENPIYKTPYIFVK